MANRLCESFIVAKADFASFVVIVRKSDNAVERVAGFKTESAARDWIANRRTLLECEPELPTSNLRVSAPLPERHDIPALS